jgi:hypothetical protein
MARESFLDSEGNHEKSPHHANRLAAFIAVITRLRPASLPRKSSRTETFGACVHVSGSFTLRRIHTFVCCLALDLRELALIPHRPLSMLSSQKHLLYLQRQKYSLTGIGYIASPSTAVWL